MKTKKILLVDDDTEVLNMLSLLMDDFGYEFATAANGEQAVDKLSKDEFALVLTDMMMPNMNGMELIKHIQNHSPHISVIAMTGYAKTFTYTDVITAGASDFITKPFEADELEAKLNRLFRELELVSQLKELSISDALTEVYNRRYFDIKILEEAQRAHRQGHNAFLIMLDVDNLKLFNDKFGHQDGDFLLRSVGGILSLCIRKNVDWAFRYGGDEFAVVLSHVDLNQTRTTAERILENFKSRDFPLAGLSMGMAKFIRHEKHSWEDDVKDMIARADKALYKAKSLGMNQIEVNGTSD